MDEWLALIRDSIMPSLKEQDGFMGFVVLVDLEHDKSIGYEHVGGRNRPGGE